MKHSEVIVDIPADVVRSIFSKIRLGGTSDCWPFQNNRSYGTISIGKNRYPAHRVVYKLFTGIDPMDSIVCHRCDNKPCVNPHHVYLGTHATNAEDRNRRNPQPRGIVRNAKSRLHPDFEIAAGKERS